MLCPYCGENMEEVAAFCPGCGKIVIPPKTPVVLSDELDTPEPPAQSDAPARKTASKKVIKRLYPPVQDTSANVPPIEASQESPAESAAPKKSPEPGRKPAKKASRLSGRMVALLIILVAVTVLSTGISIYITATTQGMRVDLTKAVTERASAEAAVSSLEKENAQLETDLAEVRSQRDDYSAQVTELTGKINDIENNIIQSSYDKESAERELTQAKEDNKALSDEIAVYKEKLSDAEAALTEATEEKDALQDDYDALGEKVAFYDKYIVFVMTTSKDKLYHTYDCKDFSKESFYAYSPGLAKFNGYSPCPKCCG